MPLTISGKITRAMAATLRRWYKRLRLQDWTIDAQVIPRQELHEFAGECEGCALMNSVYLNGVIYLADDLTPADEWVYFHELRHAHYDQIRHVFTQCWDGRRRMRKAEAERLMRDMIERCIQHIGW